MYRLVLSSVTASRTFLIFAPNSKSNPTSKDRTMAATNTVLRFSLEGEIRLGYEKKTGTVGRYVRVSGEGNLFPKTVGFTHDIFQKVRGSGRANAYVSVGQVRGEFCKNEVSPYKMATTKRPRITFSVWRCDENPLIYGFADIGFAFGDASGQVQSSGDLVVLVSPDNCRNSIEFRVFRGVYGDRELREAILKSIKP